MKSKSLKQMFLITCAACIAVFTMAGNAQAKFGVCLDTLGTGGHPTWAATKDNVKVEAKVNGNYIVLHNGPLIKAGCSASTYPANRYFFPAHSANDVEKIRISTDGTDAAWVDRVFLFKERYHQSVCTIFTRDKCGWHYKGRQVKGSNDNTGWCFSKESEGATARSYCEDGVFWRAWTLSAP